MQVFNNNTLIFSSKRKGGYGGYDLYISVMNDEGWEEPVNLGPRINSSYDEVDPFLSRSGTKLYFSTNRVESFGGYDIYSVEYLPESRRWTSATNPGFPINSAGNDRNFSVSADGMTAIFESNRPESEGGSDLYLAYFKEQVMEQLMYTEEVSFLLNQIDSMSVDGLADERNIGVSNENDENIVKKEFVNSPLYYGGDEIIMNPANTAIMKRVKDLMIIYPELHITFSGHSSKEGMKEFDLYFSIKRSEKAAEYLIQYGISPGRIAVKGLGSNFPNTLTNGNQVNRLATKNSRRIDMAFNSVPKERLTIIDDASSVSDGFRDETFYNYKSVLSDLAYKVHIAKTKQMYKADVIREYESGIIEKGMDEDSYTYTLGIFDTYNEARNLKRELIRKGVIDAKVVPYINDRPIGIAQSELLKELYPDLIDFIEYESD